MCYITYAEMKTLGFQRTLVLMLVVQPAWAAQRASLPVLPTPVSSALGGAISGLPAIYVGGVPDTPDGLRPALSFSGSDSDSNNPRVPASPDASQPSSQTPVDPPFYGRQKPPNEKPLTRKYVPRPGDSERAKNEFLRLAAVGQELFNAPSWFERSHHPELKRAIFQIAFLDEALTDLANGQAADVPSDLADDQIVEAVIARRSLAYQGYLKARHDILARSTAAAVKRARLAIERWHQAGAAAPVTTDAVDGEPVAAGLYRKMQAIAEGREKATPDEVKDLAKTYERALLNLHLFGLASKVDAQLALLRTAPVDPQTAKKIYDRSVGEAKKVSELNLRHVAARKAAVNAGTVLPAPMLGKQIRPTCTMHMLQSLLHAMGIKRRLPDLVAEARAILNDPYVGMTTAFNLEQQLRLFRHYGTVATVKEKLFETVLAHGRNLKISIEIGDPIYKHSLLLEGFYELDGVAYVALRDSTSYFPTRMTLEEFSKVLTDDAAVLFLEARSKPQP